MKTTMKKVLSLILTAAMLLSVALTAMVATSAEDSNEKFNAYMEFPALTGITSAYQGIVVDGARTTGTEVAANAGGPSALLAATITDGLYLGAAYSGATTGNDAVKPNEVHMNVFSSGAGLIQQIEFTTSGKTYVINNNKSSSWMYTSTDFTEQHPQTCYFKKFTSNDAYFEWALPLNVLRLEKVYDETDYSTDFSITVTTANGTYTKSGRLVLNDEFNPNNSLVTKLTTDVLAVTPTFLAADKAFNGTGSYDANAKSVTLTNTVDGSNRIYATFDTKTTYQAVPVNTLDWQYNVTLTVDKMPAINRDPVPSCNSANLQGNNSSVKVTPGLVFYVSDTNATNDACTQKMGFEIYNKNGTLWATTSYGIWGAYTGEALNLGVNVGEQFDLSFIMKNGNSVIVYVNGKLVGSMVNKQGNSMIGTNRYSTYISLVGNTGFSDTADQKVTVTKYTVTNSFDGVSEALFAASATPNYVPAIKFYQTSAVDNGTYNVRLIATVDKALVDAGDMTVAGFNVAASKTNAGGTVNGTTKAHRVYEVYNSITASGETVNAPEGTYFMVFTIKNIPAADTLTLNFSAFAETETAAYVEGSVFTLTFENGARKN